MQENKYRFMSVVYKTQIYNIMHTGVYIFILCDAYVRVGGWGCTLKQIWHEKQLLV